MKGYYQSNINSGASESCQPLIVYDLVLQKKVKSKVNNVLTLLNRIAQTSPGDEAKVDLIRKDKEMTLKLYDQGQT
jgi:hypothetical protein